MAGFGISLGLVKSVLTRGDGSVLKLKQHLKLVWGTDLFSCKVVQSNEFFKPQIWIEQNFAAPRRRALYLLNQQNQSYFTLTSRYNQFKSCWRCQTQIMIWTNYKFLHPFNGKSCRSGGSILSKFVIFLVEWTQIKFRHYLVLSVLLNYKIGWF